MGNTQTPEEPLQPSRHVRSGSYPQMTDLRQPLGRLKVPSPAVPLPFPSLRATLDCEPRASNILFACPGCGRQCFDGGMPKVVMCVCGWKLLRTDQGAVVRTETRRTLETTFEDSFLMCSSQFSGVLRDLEVITFGLFTDIPPEEDPKSRLFCELANLKSFFQAKKRLISEGECFQLLNSRFKVLSASPAQGFITQSTALFCTELLSVQTVDTVHLCPLAPHVLTTDLHQIIVLPYFATYQRHVHTGQYLCINGLECVVSRMSPNNGLVTRATTVTFDTQPLHTIKTLKLTPYAEDLPAEIQHMDRVANMHCVFEQYLVPHFKGWRRVMTQGESVVIQGIAFRVDSIRPTRGVVNDLTTILYHGKAASRRIEREKQIQQDEALARSLQDNLEPSISRIHRLSRNPETRDMLLQVIEMLHVISASGGPEGASQQQINLLPTHKITPVQLGEQGKCLICLCDFATEEVVRTLPCCKC